MLPLCSLLGINVNELLSGEALNREDYQKRAEENMMKLIQEKEESKKKIVLSAVVTGLTILAGVTLVLVSGLLTMETYVRVILLAVAFLVIGGGLAVACVLDREAGYFECRHCGERFVPDMKAYIAGAHTLTTRHLKCPHCGKSSYCRRRLSRK